MYLFMNEKAGRIIDEYLTCTLDYEEDMAEWQDDELALHREVEYIANHGPAAVVPESIAKGLADLWDEWKVDLAKAVYLEAVDLYKGKDLPGFKASLKSALFGSMAGLGEGE